MHAQKGLTAAHSVEGSSFSSSVGRKVTHPCAVRSRRSWGYSTDAAEPTCRIITQCDGSP
jgi:hypothetical protein